MHDRTWSTLIIRLLLLASGTLGIVLTIGFFWQLPWATRLWPWSDSHLSYIWLASICAAIAAPILWIALSSSLSERSRGSRA